MRLSLLCLTATFLTTACASEPQASLEDRTLPFGCNDIVVVGSVENKSYETVKSEDDILGHGWISATLKVREIVKGARVPPILPVKYFAHNYMRQDRDFMLVLTRTESGEYEIKTGQIASLRPRLASRCE